MRKEVSKKALFKMVRPRDPLPREFFLPATGTTIKQDYRGSIHLLRHKYGAPKEEPMEKTNMSLLQMCDTHMANKHVKMHSTLVIIGKSSLKL